MRILITGARAPACLDLARRGHFEGHEIFVADSLRFAMTMFSRVASARLLVPRAKESSENYITTLLRLIQRHQIDVLIPTCEEVFFLSRFRDQLPCKVFVDEFEKLSLLHNKFRFSQTAGNEFASAPETLLITRHEDLLPYRDCSYEWVFKPVYSRFASRTLISPDSSQLSTMRPSEENAWVAQRRIRGTEYSTYSVARSGRLVAHACYRSLYRAGKGSGICFVPVDKPQIFQFAARLVQSLNFTGQIGFDLLETDEQQLFVIECNPRATSGVHCFDVADCLVERMVGSSFESVLQVSGCDMSWKNPECLRPGNNSPLMVEFAMPIWGFADALRRRRIWSFFGDLRRSRCVSFSLRDPLPTLGLPLSLLELAWIAVTERRTLMEASTFDTEWNGEPL